MAEFSRTASESPSPPRLRDPWALRSVPLDGVLERGRFSPFWMAVTMLITGFVLFQVLGSVFGIALILMQGATLEQFANNPVTTQATYIRELLTANTIGQVLGMGLLTLGVARLHSSRVWRFLRLDRANLALIALALVGLAALMPAVGWLGEMNQLLPIPDWLREMEDMRMEVIMQALESDLSLVFIVSMLALTPAFCEELLFRGYVQRQFERSLGVAWSIALSGIIFGAYHLSALQVVPLSVLGLYMAWLTWRTGSLWPAIAVHFANNAYAAVSAQMMTREQGVPLAEVETMDLPWYIVIAALVVFVGVVGGLRRVAQAAQPPATAAAGTPEASPKAS